MSDLIRGYTDEVAENTRQYQRQLEELEAEALKRFWRLESCSDSGGWFRVVDGLGRELCKPATFTRLRGFFLEHPQE